MRAVRPHVVEALVRTMFAWDPAPVLATVGAPVTALAAMDAGDPAPRLAELRRSAAARAASGGSPVRLVEVAGAHNVMRYHAAAVAAAILGTAR